MNFFFEIVFDAVMEILEKVADKLREKRPPYETNGTMVEWILLIAMSCALTGYCLLRIFFGDNYGQTGMRCLGIFLLVLAATFVGAFLIRWILRRRRKTRDSEDELR